MTEDTEYFYYTADYLPTLPFPFTQTTCRAIGVKSIYIKLNYSLTM